MICPFCGEENISGVDNCESCGEDLTAFDKKRRPTDPLEYSLMKDSIGKIARCEPFKANPKTSIKEIAEGLGKEQHCGLVLEGQNLLGIVTIRDILQKAIFKDLDLEKTPVSKIMTANPITLKAEDNIVHALNKMAIGGYRHLPIQKEDNTFGVICVRDILDYLVEKFPTVLELKK